MDRPRLAILGAGPTGLDAALAAAEAGLPFTLYERGGGVADHVLQWGHVRLFSPWEINLSPRMRRALEAAGHEAPAGDDCPTGAELRSRALEPLAALPQVAPHLRLGHEVHAVGRAGLLKHEEIASDARAARPFRLLVLADGGAAEGVGPEAERWDEADVVIDCTGTWGSPNWLGDGGIPAPGERWVDRDVERHLPDVFGERGLDKGGRWAGRTVLVAGAGHSATTAVRDLARLAEEEPGTRVVWLLRRRPCWADEPGDGAAPDPLPERGRLQADARALYAGASPAVEVVHGTVRSLAPGEGGGLRVEVRDGDGEARVVDADRVVSLTGYVGDLDLYRQLQVHTCYATEGPMKLSAALLGAAGEGGGDCLAQESHGVDTLLNPEPGFFVLGAKSYGRNATFLMRLGYQQVDEVFARLAGQGGQGG